MLHHTLSALSLLTLLCTLTGCTSPDAEPTYPAVDRWAFAPGNTARSGSYFRVGDELAVRGDTIVAFRNSILAPTDGETLSVPVPVDSVQGFRAERTAADLLLVRQYRGDSLTTTTRFRPADLGLTDLAPGELSGRTYRFTYDGQDSLLVYFDTGKGFYEREEERLDYSVDVSPYWNSDRSHAFDGGLYFRTSSRMPLDKPRFYLRARDEAGFSSYRHQLGRDGAGRLIAVRLVTEGETYVERRAILEPIRSPLPPEMGEHQLADWLTTSTVTVDKSYAPADSAVLAYAYTEDFERRNGLSWGEADYLAVSASADGPFVLYVGDKILVNGSWRLSTDRTVIIVEGDRDYGIHFIPITAFGPEGLHLRFPLKVKTEFPRGVELESFANVDALLTLTPPGSAPW